MTWREKAKPIIYRVIKENEGKPLIEVKRALREAYPFGIRQYHPYRIWCDEVRVQLGLKKRGKAKSKKEPESQLDLFKS